MADRGPGMTADRVKAADRFRAGGHHGALMSDTVEAGTGPVDEPPVDVAVIDQLATITDSEGFSVLGELLNAFLSAAPGRLDALDSALAARDLVGVADQAHALTGSSASFGARGMAAMCRQLRAAAERDDLDAIGPLLRDLHVEFLRVRASLAELTRRGA
jgi:HPt (histidine-containing phosphotransfer) domain-containing protein